jgi:hypothetical protein
LTSYRLEEDSRRKALCEAFGMTKTTSQMRNTAAITHEDEAVCRSSPSSEEERVRMRLAKFRARDAHRDPEIVRIENEVLISYNKAFRILARH